MSCLACACVALDASAAAPLAAAGGEAVAPPPGSDGVVERSGIPAVGVFFAASAVDFGVGGAVGAGAVLSSCLLHPMVTNANARNAASKSFLHMTISFQEVIRSVPVACRYGNARLIRTTARL